MKVLYGKAANLLPARLTNIEDTWDKLKAWPLAIPQPQQRSDWTWSLETELNVGRSLQTALVGSLL